MAGMYDGLSREEILDKVSTRAKEYQEKYRGCAQCGLLALQEAFGLENEGVFKAASGLSGGGGGLRTTACGALVGGALALGLKYGRELSDLKKSPEAMKARENASQVPVGRLYKWFEREFGSLICTEVRKRFIGVDLDTKIPWQKAMADELGLHKHCCELQRKTTRKVAELLMEE